MILRLCVIILCRFVCIYCAKINVQGAMKAYVVEGGPNTDEGITRIGHIKSSDLKTSNEKVDKNNKSKDIEQFTKLLFLQSVSVLKKLNKNVNEDVEELIQNKLLRTYEKITKVNKDSKKLNRVLRQNNDGYLSNLADSVNRILKKIINRNVDDRDNKKTNLLQSVDKLTNFHYEYLCKNNNICRKKDGFLDLSKQILTILLKLKPERTEDFFLHFSRQVLKVDVDHLMNNSQRKRIKFAAVVLNRETGMTLHSYIEYLLYILSGQAKGVTTPTLYRIYKQMIELLDEAFIFGADELDDLKFFISLLAEWVEKNNIFLPLVIKDCFTTLSKASKKWTTEQVKEFNRLITMLMGETSEENEDYEDEVKTTKL